MILQHYTLYGFLGLLFFWLSAPAINAQIAETTERSQPGFSMSGSLNIEKQAFECGRRQIVVTSNDGTPLKFTAIVFASKMEGNVYLGYWPGDEQMLDGVDTIRIYVDVADFRRDAVGDIVLIESNGTETRIPYEYRARIVVADPDTVSYGFVTAGALLDERCVALKNEKEYDVTVKKVLEGPGVEITSVSSVLPALLKPGETLEVCVRGSFSEENKGATHHFTVALDCASLVVPVTASTERACLQMYDLHFGELKLDLNNPDAEVSRTYPYTICNQGGGPARFGGDDPGEAKAVTWLLENFEVAPGDLEGLKNLVLGPGECYNLSVTFRAGDTGIYRTTAHVRSDGNQEDCRNTSIWSAVVVPASSSDVAYETVETHGKASVEAHPNPFTGETVIRFRLPEAANVSACIYDASGKEVKTLLREDLPSGSHAVRWDASACPSGMYYCRISADTRHISVPLLLVR